jgi:hypothetical protein
MIELLAGDRYNLKPESILFIAGTMGVLGSLELIVDQYRPSMGSPDMMKAAARSFMKNIEEKTNKELGYQSIFGVGNQEAALRSTVSELPSGMRYNVFLFREEGKEPMKPDGSFNHEVINEAKAAYDSIVLAYKTCKMAYDGKDKAELISELQDNLAEVSKQIESGNINPATTYAVGYLGRNLGAAYQTIASDALLAVDKHEFLKSLNIESTQVAVAILNWNKDLVRATREGDLQLVTSLRNSLDTYMKRIDAKLNERTGA